MTSHPQAPLAERTACHLSIIIITCNRKRMLTDCLNSIEQSVDDSPPDYEIIVVDNGSKDGTVEMLQQDFPQVHVIANAKNLGVGPARNIGLSVSTGQYLFLLDDDTLFIQKGTLSRIVSFMNSFPQYWVMGPKLISRDGELQHSCRRSTTLLTILCRRTTLGSIFPSVVRDHLMIEFDHSHVREVDWVQGAALIMRRKVITKFGYLKSWFYGYEDEEICDRVWRNGGQVAYDPEITIVHDYSRLSAGGINKFTVAQLSSWIQFYFSSRFLKKR